MADIILWRALTSMYVVSIALQLEAKFWSLPLNVFPVKFHHFVVVDGHTLWVVPSAVDKMDTLYEILYVFVHHEISGKGFSRLSHS